MEEGDLGDGGRDLEEMRTWVGRTTLSRVNLKENIVELFFSRGVGALDGTDENIK
jgi:hypothetical protein